MGNWDERRKTEDVENMPIQKSDQPSHKGFFLWQGQTHITHQTKNQTDEKIMIISWNRVRL